LDLTRINPKFNFYDEDQPIYTHPRNLPPSKLNKADMNRSLATEGCVITNAIINDSIIGVRTIIESGTELNGVVCMGADSYENEEQRKRTEERGIPHLGIGRNCKIANTIIDKNARIGDNCQIGVSGKVYEDGEHGEFYTSNGIIVIRKNAVIPSGTIF
jgi:glucose-1-phosphate adenylyltransferase